MWQFLCDSAHDSLHLWGRYGQKTPWGWWGIRMDEWKRVKNKPSHKV